MVMREKPGKGALAGIRILDFSWAMAGPASTELLSFLGAEVIKVETCKRPDVTRFVVHPVTKRPFEFDPQPFFIGKNLNKLGVRLDLSHPKAIELAKRLVAICDVVVESFRPGAMTRLGLDYEVIRGIRPDIIMLSTCTAGSKGPQARYAGYAPLFTAYSGVGLLTGYTDGPPTEMRVTIDGASALFNAYAILAALVHRQKTGEGQHIDEASEEAVACLISDSLMDYTMNGKIQTRNSNLDEIMAPHNCYPCKGKDRWISIAIATEAEWQGLCTALGNPDWSKQEVFADPYSRWKNQDRLDELISGWTINYTDYEAMEILQRAGVAAVPSFDAEELFSDPHLAEREFTDIVEHPVIGAWVAIAPPWKLSATPAKITSQAPSLGQHNEYVFGKLLNIAPEEMAQMKNDGVFQ
ncbi:MAG: CoA transferase [Dehalococcoidia bacterium]|nr:CoA transferase [Dehalococcoidia bacterium]